eukprot:3084068-Pyramimonas_sp.AAC.1
MKNVVGVHSDQSRSEICPMSARRCAQILRERRQCAGLVWQRLGKWYDAENLSDSCLTPDLPHPRVELGRDRWATQSIVTLV